MAIPITQWKQFSTNIDPSGNREKTSGFGFIKILDTSAPSGQLRFSTINNTFGTIVSNTEMVIWRVTNLNGNTQVFNTKVFLSSISDWGAGTYRFLYRVNKDWLGSGFLLTASDGDVPTNANNAFDLSPSSGLVYNETTERNVSQYLYLAVLAENNVPQIKYGGAADAGFRYKIVMDYC